MSTSACKAYIIVRAIAIALTTKVLLLARVMLAGRASAFLAVISMSAFWVLIRVPPKPHATISTDHSRAVATKVLLEAAQFVQTLWSVMPIAIIATFTHRV